MSQKLTVNIDGGARGNPGPAGWGAVVAAADGAIVAELHGGIPHATNNVAEYSGLAGGTGLVRDAGSLGLYSFAPIRCCSCNR